MENKQPVLSICMPIYNRIEFLKRHLDQYLKCKSLFDEKIHLFISDNCSKDDLQSLVNEYSNKGLNIDYSRNKENIGPDGNFMKCFNSAKGKYIWLLGSDDIPVDGFVERLVDFLESNDYGYVFLKKYCDDKKVIEYNDAGDILQKINIWITFMSANIFKSEFVKKVKGENYMGTYLIQVPYFLEGIIAGQTNAIFKDNWIQDENDAANNGGYNFFIVFVDNLLAIVYEKVENHQIDINCYQKFKRSIYKNFVSGYVYDLLIKRDKNKRERFNSDNAWKILMKHYRFNPYFYILTARTVASRIYNKLKGLIPIFLIQRIENFQRNV